MKKIHEVNEWSVTITILLCFTFWGGIIALPILGLIQIIISLYIVFQISKLSIFNKIIFIVYILLIPISIITLGKLLKNEESAILFFWPIISIFLAIFHLYITYLINKDLISKNES